MINEGPLTNFTGIGFPSASLFVYKRIIAPGRTEIFRFHGGASYFDTTYDGFVASDFQAILRGKTSGTSVDFRSVPVALTRSNTSDAGPPTCLVTWDGWYKYPSGSAVGATKDAFSGAVLLSSGGASAQPQLIELWVQEGREYDDQGTPDPADDTCNALVDAPALPAFTVGEEIELLEEL